MSILTLDHIQLAMPAGHEAPVRAFYIGILGMVEVPKPLSLQGRGGFWAKAGDGQVHFGVDADFHPAKKAHPCFRVADLNGLATKLDQAGHDVVWDDNLVDVRRFFTFDPAGNRVEIMAG